MPFKTAPLILALMSAVAFTMAFISVGVLLLSISFALMGSLALGMLLFVWTKRLLKRRIANRLEHDRLHSI